jgi:cbb3-type cytochrome oxidase maturation protein
MNIIYILLPLALILGLGFLIAFIKTSAEGQYDDLETPAQRILLDEPFEILDLKKGTKNVS